MSEHMTDAFRSAQARYDAQEAPDGGEPDIFERPCARCGAECECAYDDVECEYAQDLPEHACDACGEPLCSVCRKVDSTCPDCEGE